MSNIKILDSLKHLTYNDIYNHEIAAPIKTIMTTIIPLASEGNMKRVRWFSEMPHPQNKLRPIEA